MNDEHTIIREDFLSEDCWSYAEAAAYAGVTEGIIEQWDREWVMGQRRFLRGHVKGAF